MGLERQLGIALLLGVVVTSHFGMFNLAERNGTFSFASIFAFKERILPNSRVAVHIPRTGIDVVDNYLAFMLSVFWVDLDPKNVRAHIQGHHFLGTLSSTWLLMLLETHRGRKGATFIATTYLLEFVGELAGLGLFTPLWCIIHFLATSTPSAKTKTEADRTLLPRQGTLKALGHAIIVGHVVPTLMMSFGKLDQFGVQSQQVWILVRLCHPILVFTLWSVFSSFQGNKTSQVSAERRAASSRKFYTFSIVFSALHHMTSLSIIFAEHWIPGWIKPEVLASLRATETFLPFPFWRSDLIKPVSFTDGIAIFLQWDEALTALAMVIWTSVLFVESVGRSRGETGAPSVFLQAALLGVVAGPVAAAAFLLQERDNLVLSAEEHTAKKDL